MMQCYLTNCHSLLLYLLINRMTLIYEISTEQELRSLKKKRLKKSEPIT